jgi:hypothetical protein
MTVSFRPAKREQIPLLLGVAGGTGSGKTLSALRMARGIAEGGPFAFVDTENGRGLHYADQFPEMQHGDLRAPFRPDAYTDAIQDGFAHLKDVPKERRVVVVDSFSHEWTGDGGCLDWVDEITNGDPKRNPQAWAKVKPAHRKMMTRLLGLDAHVILCLRAEYGKMDIIRKDGKTEFVPKRTLPGGSLDGWTILSEKDVPYELTASFLVISDAPGIPRPLKLQEQHKQFVPLDQPLSEQTGKLLAAWAAGSSSGGPNDPVSGHEQPAQATETAPSKVVPPADSGVEPASPDDEITLLTAELVGASREPGKAAATIERHRLTQRPDEHYGWLLEQKAKLAARGGDAA